MLLAIDVGNTETVIGLFAHDGRRGRVPPAERRRLRHRRRGRAQPRPHATTGGCRPSPTAPPTSTPCSSPSSSTSRACDIVDDGHRASPSAPRSRRSPASSGRWPTRWFDDVPVRRPRPGREERHADPLRQPQGGRRRPGRQRRRRLRPLRRPVRSSSTSAPPPPSTPSPPPASTSAGRSRPGVAISLEALFQHAAALRRVELVAPARRDRPLDGRVDPVRRALRLRRPGRRAVPAVRGRARARRRWSPPAASASWSPRTAETVEHVEPWLTLHGLRIVYERNVRSAGRGADRAMSEPADRRAAVPLRADRLDRRPRSAESTAGPTWPRARSPARWSRWPGG